MSDFQVLDLGHIMETAAALKAAKRQDLTDQLRQRVLQAQATQTEQQTGQQQGVDQFLAKNPNASLQDLSQFGLTGVDAATKLIQARNANSLEQNRQMYTAANVVANADDPKATTLQVAPQFPQQYDSVHGQGSWDALTPDQVKQQAGQLAQHALLGLVDPAKQFQAQQEMVLAHYKQQGPGGEAARNANTIAAENQRAAASRAVTMRGQDLSAQDKGIPAGYEKDPANPGALRPIAGGPHDPNAVAAGMDSRSSVMFNRVASSAQSALKAISNIAELPITSSTGFFGHAEPGKGLYDSVKAVLSQKVTGQEAQDYKTMVAGVARNLSTIETAGLAPNGSITTSMNSVLLNEGDTQMTKLRKMAEMRQIVEEGLKPQLANPKLAPAQKELVRNIISGVQQAVPFTHHDITLLQQSKNPNATIKDFATQQGLPTTPTGDPSTPAPAGRVIDFNSLPK